jgi:hypothetical protein
MQFGRFRRCELRERNDGLVELGRPGVAKCVPKNANVVSLSPQTSSWLGRTSRHQP